ncbi:sugar transport protein [Serratia fonticola]|nr:sugar transport protein [Serratia fonticola]
MSHQRKHNTGYILRICGIAALGGILFGYDTAVISGAIEALKAYFDLSPAETGWAVSNVVIGCVVGAFGAGPLAGRYGRKKALVVAAFLFYRLCRRCRSGHHLHLVCYLSHHRGVGCRAGRNGIPHVHVRSLTEGYAGPGAQHAAVRHRVRSDRDFLR